MKRGPSRAVTLGQAIDHALSTVRLPTSTDQGDSGQPQETSEALETHVARTS